MGEPGLRHDVHSPVEQLNKGTVPPALARERNLILAILLALAIVAWVVLLREASGGEMSGMSSANDTERAEGPGPALDLSMGASAALFIGMWAAMMVGMMFTAAAPMILMYARTQRGQPLNTTIFTGAYIVVWVAFGAVAFLFAVAIEGLVEGSGFLARHWGRFGGALIVAAALYQLTPLKNVCLRHCRSPMSFIMTSWRPGAWGAARMGFLHAVYCTGCCWLLFAIIVPIGMMNVSAMLLVAALVFAEKALPWARATRHAGAAVLMAYGVSVMVRPGLLPTVA